VAVRDGDVPEAERLGRVARALARGTGERRLELTPTRILAGCDHPRAIRLLAALDNALRAAGQILDPDDAIEQTALRERLITTLGRQSFESVYTTGAGLGLRDALDV
jgi:hypothetical protein